MRAVVQRVSKASVSVEGNVVGSIQKGLCVLVGIKQTDSIEDVDYICRKLVSIRLFDNSTDADVDASPKQWSRSVQDVRGELLCVSQFTLFAQTKKGTKPDFHMAMKSDQSKLLYEQFLDRLGKLYDPSKIKDGVFGAMMSVEIANDGPVTIIIDSPETNNNS